MAASAPPCRSGDRTRAMSCCRMFPPASWPSEDGCVTASVDRKLSAIWDTCMSLSEISGGSSARTASTMTEDTAELRSRKRRWEEQREERTLVVPLKVTCSFWAGCPERPACRASGRAGSSWGRRRGLERRRGERASDRFSKASRQSASELRIKRQCYTRSFLHQNTADPPRGTCGIWPLTVVSRVISFFRRSRKISSVPGSSLGRRSPAQQIS